MSNKTNRKLAVKSLLHLIDLQESLVDIELPVEYDMRAFRSQLYALERALLDKLFQMQNKLK